MTGDSTSMTGDSTSVNNPFDGPSTSSVLPDKTRMSRKSGKGLRWMKALRFAVILFVSVLLALPLVMFYLPQQGGCNEVSVIQKLYYLDAVYQSGEPERALTLL